MAKTYQQLQTEIEMLQKKADAARKKELADVIKEIKGAIESWGLTASDLGLDAAGSDQMKVRSRKRATKAPRAAKKATRKSAVKPKFRDEQGNTWGGRGPRPAWLRAAIEGGKSLEDFRS